MGRSTGFRESFAVCCRVPLLHAISRASDNLLFPVEMNLANDLYLTDSVSLTPTFLFSIIWLMEINESHPREKGHRKPYLFTPKTLKGPGP